MAMSTMAMSSFNQDFICGVCREVYKSPRLLPCHHTFCMFCIEQLARANGSRFPCPQCRDPVQLPPQGALGFKANFYIKEEDLERARKGFDNVCPVPAHNKDKELMTLFCMDCDKPICMRCSVTVHKGHEIEDLSNAAEKCQQPLEQSKKRLDEAIKFLTQRSEQARGDLEAATMKSEAIKEEVKLQRDVLAAKLNYTVDIVMREASEVNSKTKKQLERTHRSLQEDLDSIVQLRQRLSSSLEAGSDADKVYIEKEMRTGAGSTERLKAITDSAPVTTFRQVLNTEVGISDLDLFGFIGEPNMMPIAIQTKCENITPFVQLEKDQPCRRIHSVAKINGSLRVCIGGLPSRYKKAVMYQLDGEGKVAKKNNDISKRAYKQCSNDKTVCAIYLCPGNRLKTMAKADAMFIADYETAPKSCLISCVSLACAENGKYSISATPIMSITSNTLVAFDALASGKKFAMIEEFESQDETESDSEEKNDSDDKTESDESVKVPGKRVVRLYDPDHKEGPGVTYIPPREPFLPMDLCFWHHENEELLLIADWQNDCIHVVDTKENKMEFVRFLAAASGHLVRPTALNVGEDGVVWIGCDNGCILKCQKIDSKAECDENTEDGDKESSSEDEDTEMAGPSGHLDSSQPPSPASTELSLNDDGILPSVSSVSSASSSRTYRSDSGRVRYSPYFRHQN